MRRRAPLGVVVLASLAIAGCGESRQERFAKAMRAAEVAQAALASAEDELASREAEAAALASNATPHSRPSPPRVPRWRAGPTTPR